MNPEVILNADANPESATLHVTGDLDYVTTGPVVDAVRSLLEGRPTLQTLHLDCAELDFCDSAGLSGLLAVYELAETDGVLLHLDNRPSQLDRLLDLTGTSDYLLAQTVDDGTPSTSPSDESELG